MALPNVDIGDSDRERIRRFVQQTDMRQYVHDFLASRMSAAVPQRRVVRPEPKIEAPTVTIPRPPRTSGQTLSIQVVRASSFVELMDADPNSRLVLDLNVAGRRWRSGEVEADADPKFYDSFSVDLPESLEELVAYGAGSMSAILISGPNSCVYGSGIFDWRRALCGYVGLPVSLNDARTGDACGVVHLKLQMEPALCTAAELEAMLKGETARASHICKLSSRLTPTPFHALRFAGLLSSSRKTFGATGNVVDAEADPDEEAVFTRGFSVHSTLASRSGSSADICAVLCSLLCGFGFEAYVCGNKVLTIHDDRATLWDPFKCERANVERLPTTILYGYKCRLEPLVEDPAASIDDPRIWKRVELPPPLSTPSLLRCEERDEVKLEEDVKKMIMALRHTKQTKWDDRIAAAMRPLLYSYEASKLNESCDVWTPHVNDAVRHLIPPRSTIKAVPLCVHAADAKAVFMAIQTKASNVIQHPEAQTLVLSLALFPYAEDLFVTWLVFGAILPQTK